MKTRILLLVLISAAILAGAALVGPSLDGARGAFILWNLRVPRVVVGAMVGGTLGIVGAVFQAIFSNGLATPDTVGTTAGATLGALAALVLGAPALGGLPIVVAAAFAGALSASAIVAAVAAGGRARMYDVLLVGIAVTLASGAISTGLQYAADMSALFASAQWSLGQLPQVGYRGAVLMLPFVLVCVVSLLSLSRALSSLAVGEDMAHAQGVDVRRVRTLALGMGSLGVAACVAWCGPIAFVGLLVPHLVRLLVGSAQRVMLPMSLVVGAAFLVGCDTLARVVLPGRDLPVGVITAALGAPALIVLIARARR